MIFDMLSYAPLYAEPGSRIARGFDWLAAFDRQTPDGRYSIDGDAVYALVQSYQTVDAAEKRFESHRNYLDIQFIAEGSEVIYYAPTRVLTPSTLYDSAQDFLLYADPADSTPLLLARDSFAIFYPQDGHKPGCKDGAHTCVKKVVVKILA